MAFASRQKIKARPLASADQNVVAANHLELITTYKSSYFEANSENSSPRESIEQVEVEKYENMQYETNEDVIEEVVEEEQEQEQEEEQEEEEEVEWEDEEKLKMNYEQLQADIAKKQEILRGFLEKSQRRCTSAETEKSKSKKTKNKADPDNFPQLKDEKSIFELKNSTINTQKHFESKPLTKPNIYSMLRLSFEQNLSPTVRIQIKNVFVDCHLTVLQSYSDFFSKCGNAQLIVLPSQCVSASAFRMYYAWCLAGNPMVSVSTIVDLMKTAMYLRVSVLVDICFQHLYDDLFSEDVAFFVYIKAHNAGLSFVAHLMLTRIGRFFLPMVACREFLNLDPREMLELLDADLIGVHTESEVLFSLVRWSSHDWETRQRFMPRLVRKVRFGLMPVWYLYVLARGTGVPVLDRVLRAQGVKKFITDSIVFALEREETNTARDELFKEIHLSKVPTFRERLWIVDEKAQRSESYASLSYGEFLKYLKNLRTRDLSEFHNFTLGSSPKPRDNNARKQQPKKHIVMFKKPTESEDISEVQQQQQKQKEVPDVKERKFDTKTIKMRVKKTKGKS